MPEQALPPVDSPVEHATVRYEKTDASFSWVLGLLLGAMALGIVIFAAILMFFHGYNDSQSALRKSTYPLAPGPAKALDTLPPEPRLEQIDRLRGIETPNVFKREESKESLLGSYGPTGDKGFIHVPIDQAMKHLAGKLRARVEKAEAVPRDNGLVDAGEPNSGRLPRKEPKWSAR